MNRTIFAALSCTLALGVAHADDFVMEVRDQTGGLVAQLTSRADAEARVINGVTDLDYIASCEVVGGRSVTAPAPDAGRQPTHPLLAKRHESVRVDYSCIASRTTPARRFLPAPGPPGWSQRAREMADEVHAELDATDDAWTQEDIERVQGTLLPRVYDCLNLLEIALPAAQPTGSAAPSNPAVPPGFALMPKRMTLAMRQVLNGDEWDWADLLEAAEVITEDEHRSILRYDSLALIEKFEEMASIRYPAYGALPALSMSYAPYADVEFRDDSGKLLGVVCAGPHQAGMVSALRSAAGTSYELDRSQEQAPR